MKGYLYKIKDGWAVREYDGKYPAFREFMVCSDQIDELQASISTMIDNNNREVEFYVDADGYAWIK